MSNQFLDDLKWRGLLAQTTDETELAKALEKPITAYIGFDPTAPSLHVGNLVVLLVLRRLQLAGHKPIALVGGATGLVGDPSGRNDERTLNEESLVSDWVARIRDQVSKFLDFDAKSNPAIVVNNLDWTKDLSALELLRGIGKHFSVNQMLSKDSVSSRLESGGISYTEFSYQVLQALDYLELFRRHDCTLQLGGSDQWGNIVQGVELGRRISNTELFGFTCPLITTSSGAKMGKTAAGAVWLNADMLPVYDYWQYWRNTEDADVGRFLKLFTELPIDEIRRLEALGGAEINEAKKILANEATAMVHGRGAAEQAAAELHQALSRAVDRFNQAARTPAGVPPTLRRRLARTSSQVAAQRDAVARAVKVAALK